MPSFLGGKSRGAFGQPAFFLAGNRMTIVAFEKEVSLKASASLAFNDCSRVLKFYSWQKKHVISINGKKKFKRILVEGKKFKLRKLHSKDFIALFSSRRRVCPVLKHNWVSEVFKGSKVHDFEYYDERNYVLKWSFTFDFKKLLENALRFVTDSWIFCHAQPISLAWTDLRFWKCNANCI